jgi:signal transduction histidine kinase
MEPTKLLIVDAKRSHQKMLLDLVSSPDVDPFVASSLEEALALSAKHEFALALVAAQLPAISGLDVARRLRGEGQNRTTPIIFITGPRQAKQVLFEGYEQGVVDILIRPLEPHIVRSKVRVFVELHQSKIVMKSKLAEVRRLAAAAEKANHIKSRFLANISHEIRTPLSAIIGHAELLHSYAPSAEERRHYLGAILQNGHLLTEIINNVLDLSKIEAGLLHFEKLSFPLEELLSDMRMTFQLEAQQKGIRLDVQHALPGLQITSDPTRLRQVLYNVIGNAMKFTSVGSIEVSTRLVDGDGDGDGARPPVLEFLVTDTGCGLSDADADHLFKPFTQADTSTTRRFGGTGLGLSISRHLAHGLGGEVTLQRTALGVGSTFAVRIDPTPLAEELAAAGEELLPDSPCDPDGLPLRLDDVRVLMVEDSKHIRSFVRRLLELSGAKVDEADGGEQALLKANREAYDVILMDIQMPGMDGFEATRRLRERGLTMPIVAFTAHALKEERDRCLQGGFDTHITKPIEHRKLISTLAALIKRSGGAAARPRAPLM